MVGVNCQVDCNGSFNQHINQNPPGTFLLLYKDTFTLFSGRHYNITYLPALVTKPIVSELFLDPDINLIQRHLLLGGGHGQAYQRRVGVWWLGAPIIREVHMLRINF